MNANNARRKILWEVRIIGSCCALILSSFADFMLFREIPFSPRILVLSLGSALSIYFLPDRFFWSKERFSILRTMVTAGFAPNLCGLFIGIFVAIMSFVIRGPVPGFPFFGPPWGSLLESPLALAIFPSWLFLGILNYLGFLIGLAVGVWASWRHKQLLLGPNA